MSEQQTQPPAPVPGPGPAKVSEGTYKRLTSGVGQLVIALAACLLLVGIIMLISPGNGVLSTGGHKQILPTADPAEGATGLQYSAPYVSWAPQGLPATWTCTSSRLGGAGDGTGKTPVSWHVGYVTAAGQYAALEESNAHPAADFADRMANIDVAAAKNLKGTIQINGVTWQEFYRADKHQNSLVRLLPDVTLVVTGTASYQELAVLAGSLHEQPKQPQQTP